VVVVETSMAATSELSGLLARLLPLPTAPFHESFVRSFLCEELRRAGIDFESDEFGNVVAGSLDKECPIACVAHMDHPGFEIVEGGAGRAAADWFGGVDAKYFIGSRVVVYDRGSGEIRGRGVVEKVTKNPQGRVERMSLTINGKAEPGDFGTWNLVPFRRRGERIYTKGADDLVGCAVILMALKLLKARGLDGRLAGFFTRAEEQGFVGTLGMIRAGSIPLATKIVSVETSKVLSGVALGGGPVIRLGDRSGMFHHEMVLFMDYVAAELKKQDQRFVFQRRVMDGGTCEATPYALRGHIAGGIAVPLHNYHNQAKKRIGPEGVDLGDVQGAVKFLIEMIARINDFGAPVRSALERFDGTWQRHCGRLSPES
jgi:putative aminopeptidase FrvX